jgi:VWFA-related protein
MRSSYLHGNSPRSRRAFLRGTATCLGAGALLPILPAQQEPTTFSTEVKVVNLLANVRGKNGELIRDLSKDDFVLTEDGRPQSIRYFSRETDLPLTLGLMVDTSMSQHRVVEAERAASFRFVDQVLREKLDHVFLVQFDMSVEVRQKLTSSRRDLEKALEQVNTPTMRQLELQRGGGTLLYEAVGIAARDVMRPLTGRKALIILSDGVDFGSEISASTAIEEAQRADTLIYSIVFSDAYYYGGFGGDEAGGRAVLQRMSRETGGSCFEGSKRVGLDQIFESIQAELRSQYSLGFVSDQPVRISEFRKLQLKARTKGLAVQSQTRYWAQR